MRMSQSALLAFFLTTFSMSSFAEYYFVGKGACSDKRTPAHYKDEGSFNNRYSTNVSYNYYEKTYNLDLITGDDDPYVYPGMNIDN